MFTLFSLKSHFLSQFPLKQPFSSEMLLAPRMKCLSLWHGIGEHLVTSKERLSAAAKQPVDDSGNCWTKSVCRKKSDEKGFVQWTPIAYLFFLNESCSGFCLFPAIVQDLIAKNSGQCNRTNKENQSTQGPKSFWVFLGGFPWISYTRIMVSCESDLKVQHRSETGLVSPSGSSDFGSYESHATAAMYPPEKNIALKKWCLESELCSFQRVHHERGRKRSL